MTNSDEMCWNIACRNGGNTCSSYLYKSLSYFVNRSGFEGAPCGTTPGYSCSSSLQCVPNNPPDICSNHIKCTVTNLPLSQSNDIVITFVDNSTTMLASAIETVAQPAPVNIIINNRTFPFSSVPLISPTTIFTLEYATPLVDIGATILMLTCTDAYNQNPPFNITDRFPADLVFPPQLSHPEDTLPVTCQFYVSYPSHNYSVVLPSLVMRVAYTRVPLLFSACPYEILSEVPSTVIIQGTHFTNNNSRLMCIFGNNSATPATYISPQSVSCDVIYAMQTNTSIAVPLSVSNDAITYAVDPILITVSGACNSIKPNSVPQGARCVCSPGYSDMGGYCQPCSSGTYQPNYDQQSCIPCDGSEDTAGVVGSTDKSACMCKDNTYRYSGEDAVCGPCPYGLSCTQARGVTTLPGHWVSSQGSIITSKCPLGDSQCAGGSGAGDELCAKGYRGPLCNVCAPGYGPLGNECVKCPEDSVNGFILFLLISVSVLLFYFLVKTTTRPESQNDLVGAVIKLTFSYLQILYYIGKTSANWGGNSPQFFAAIIPVTMSSSFVSIHCSTQFGFYKSIALMMLLPVLVLFAIGTIMLCSYLYRVCFRDAIKMAWLESVQDFERYCIVILVMVHPAISQDVIRSFRCQKVSGTGTSYLVDDMSIDCSTTAYHAYQVVASLYMIFYIFGLLVYIFRRLTNNEDTVKMAAAGVIYAFEGRMLLFMVRGYKRDNYLWEFAIMARKLSIVIINSLLVPSVQMLWAAIVLSISLGLTIIVDPFESLLCGILEMVCLTSLLFVAVLGMHNELLADPDTKTVFVLLVLVSTATTALLFASIFHALQPLIIEMHDKIKLKMLQIKEYFADKSGREFGDSSIVMQVNPRLAALAMNEIK